MSLVRLTDIEGNVIHVKDIDILDGTPLIDIKPYIKRWVKYHFSHQQYRMVA